MKYIANPVEVEAQKIKTVSGISLDGKRRLILEDGEVFLADAPMMSRMFPCAGDYVVTQADGYVYLNPKEVFERKYSPKPDQAMSA